MKVANYYGVYDIRVEEVPIPEIDDDEILLKVKACAICGTDLRIYKFGHFKIPTGTKRVLGHETSGQIVKTGANVKDFGVGDRVALPPNVGCGTCHMCIQGFNQLCPTYEAFGISLDGGFGEYLKVPAFALGNLVRIPDHVSYEEAALAEPLSCVYNAYEAYRTVPGETVLVIGAGPIGALHVMMNKMAGGRVIVADISNTRLEGFEKFGADALINSSNTDLKAEMEKLTGGLGADVVITACSVPEMQALALEIAGYHGRVCLFGGMPKGRENVTLNTNLIHYKELFVTATTGSSFQDFYNSMRIISTGRMDVKSIITQRFHIDDIISAFDYAAKGVGMKALISFEN